MLVTVCVTTAPEIVVITTLVTAPNGVAVLEWLELGVLDGLVDVEVVDGVVGDGVEVCGTSRSVNAIRCVSKFPVCHEA